MIMNSSLTLFETNPIIASVKNDEQLARALHSECGIIFFLYGNICNISQLVERVKDAGKHAFIHLDLMTGLAGKEIAADFVKKFTRADGVISTKPPILKHAKELGLITILRLFILDSIALDNIGKQRASCDPDLMEIMPGLMPKIIYLINSRYRTPVIAGGLIRDKDDIVSALSAGALCISTTYEPAWKQLD